MNQTSTTKVVYNGVNIGNVVAGLLSVYLHGITSFEGWGLFWLILHTYFGWLYVFAHYLFGLS